MRRYTWAPAGMEGGHYPPGNIVKRLCTLVVTVNGSVDELFMHYLHNLLSASGGFTLVPYRGSIPEPRWDFRLHTPNLPIPWKKSMAEHPIYRLHLDISKMYFYFNNDTFHVKAYKHLNYLLF